MKADTAKTAETAPAHSEALAAFCAGLRADEIPSHIRHRLKLHLMDTVGAALAGTRSTEFRAAQIISATGPAFLLGTGQPAAARDAALVNGIAAHVFELDDSGGCDHTGAVVLPALLAALSGSDGSVSGADFLAALCAGYEVGRRILDASGGYGVHNGAGWHSTGTCGTLAAAAAVSRLRRYDRQMTHHAITLATSFSSGLWAFIHDGSQAKKIHAGRAAEGGLLAADLARAGIKGPSCVFDDVWGGFFRSYARVEAKPVELSSNLGQDWKIERASLKPYAACRGAHSAIDAVADMLAERGVSAAEVATIDLRLSPFLMDMCGKAQLDTLAGAQMSLGYALAAQKIFGEVGLSQYAAKARRDPRIASFLPQIRFHPDPAMEQMSEPVVTLTFSDGSQTSHMVPRATGSSERPMRDTAIRDKFDSLAGMVLDADQYSRLAAFLTTIDEQPDCWKLISLLTANGLSRPIFS